MRIISILLITVILSACAVVENLPRLKSNLEEQLKVVNKGEQMLSSSFVMSSAQLVLIKEKFSNTEKTLIQKLQTHYNIMNTVQTVFTPRAQEFKKQGIKATRLWTTYKSLLKINQKGWKETKDFKAYFNKEFESIYPLIAEYSDALEGFNALLTSPKLVSVKQSFPTNTNQAEKIIKLGVLKQNYKNYNQAVLEELTKKITLLPTDFIGMAKLAKLEKSVSVKPRSFGAFPRGVSGLASEEAKKMVSNALKPNIISAAESFARQQKNVIIAITELKNLRDGKYKALYNVISDKHEKQINKLFQNQKSKLINDIILEDYSEVEKILKEVTTYTERLQKLSTRDNEFLIKWAKIVNEPLIVNHIARLRKVRLAQLKAITPNIMKKISTASAVTQLTIATKDALLPIDAATDEVKKIRAAQAKKLAQLIKFKPIKNSKDLRISSFTAQDLNFEAEVTALYLGDFENSRLDPNSLVVSTMFSGYLEAFSQYCPSYLPTNRVPITEQKCAREQVTRDGWGYEKNRVCIEWVDVPTGLYADPKLYKVSKNLSDQVSSSVTMNLIGTMMSGGQSSTQAVDDSLALGDDMVNLVRTNKCDNAGLKRFENNLHRFVAKAPSLRLPNKETLADLRSIYNSNFSVESVNFDKLLNDLIIENAKGWRANHYISKSIYNVQVNKKSVEGAPISISAFYRYSSLLGSSTGSVNLTFHDNRPKCMFFSDNTRACRKPAKSIVNKYEKGQYLLDSKKN